MTRYQLLEGQHVEADVSEQGRRVQRGETFESQNDWYAQLWPEKFKKLDGQPVNPAYVFDPTKESAEEFVRRVQALQQSQSQTSPAPISTPTATEEEDAYERDLEAMTVPELQAQAHNAGIDLKGATRKSEIIRLIKAALLTMTP